MESNNLYTEAVNLDQATLAQVEEIQKEIAKSCELVSKLEPLSNLESEYSSDDHVYQAKIQHLKTMYSNLRRTRGDGNCFFRAFGFAYLETLLTDKSDLPRFREAIIKCKDSLLALGDYPSFTVDDFHETFMEVLDSVANTEKEMSLAALTETFQDQGLSDYVVCYLRTLTSGYLQANADFFQAFIEGGRTVKEYCSQEVEPMYKESDHLHITALVSALGVSVRVQYMDRGGEGGGGVNHHDFFRDESSSGSASGSGAGGGVESDVTGASSGGSSDAPPSRPLIHMLYRPGHYDILYQ